MRILRSLSLIGALALAACSGISVNQDFNPNANFARLTTWDWMPEPAGAAALDDLTRNRLRAAIEGGLEAKGFVRSTSGEPTFRVGYQILLDDRVDYETVNDYWGPGWGYRGIYGPYGGGTTTSRTYANEYTVGTLVLDFFDVADRELVWRGSAEGRLHENVTPQERQERADLAVAKILEQYPPSQ